MKATVIVRCEFCTNAAVIEHDQNNQFDWIITQRLKFKVVNRKMACPDCQERYDKLLVDQKTWREDFA